ncbi:phage portal protein [[Clostridium] symbiosum]|uniref:phage portal protein n=1 Tax=Clostridium symbiosum TaxID=1512 RepID=UPI0018975CDB|nr:phage portal protein [[Clostridium] symbiosum]DAF82386.1 MAG TPA: portal protein [Caudoviricetes sp.]
MWSFRLRADPEPEKKETESNEDALLWASLSDDYMTREQAMNVPAFAACVNKIAETVSTIPIRLYKLVDGKLEAVEDDTRVQLLNDDTGDTLDGVQFKRALTRDYLVGKGGYAFINRTGNWIRSLHYVKENEVSFLFTSDPIFKDYDIMIQGTKYKPFEFLKILRNTEDGRSGRSVVDENSEVLSVAYHSLKYEKNLVKTGGNKKGFVKSAKKLAEPAIKALKAAWRRLYQNNTENVVILNDGLEFQEASNTSVEMQLNENKKTNSDEICKLFNMPPAMINGGATEQDKINFVQYCLNPILKEFECALNRDLLLESEKGSFYFAADTSELTKGDIEKRFRAYETASKNGFMQIDEIRLRENMPPLGLDFVRLGLQDVLYDPETKQFYMPNMNQTGGLGQKESEPKQKEGEKKNEDRVKVRQRSD